MSEIAYSLEPAAPADWAQCEPHLRAALEHTKDWTIEDVALAALRGYVALWKVECLGQIVGAGATTVTRYPRRQVMDILLFGGAGFPELLDTLKQLARSAGCASISGRGRKGWLRALPGAQQIPAWEVEV